ncbi:SET and MYND domain-containing protein 3 [Mortierella sp. AM989]|nr:SET and MYND domain-containing protein 3 [Mortierella sp. AM989]
MDATLPSAVTPEQSNPPARMSSKSKRNYRTKKLDESDIDAQEEENVNEQAQQEGSKNEPAIASPSSASSSHPYVQSQNAQSLGEVYPGLARLSFLDQEQTGVDEADNNDSSFKKSHRPLQQRQLQQQIAATEKISNAEGRSPVMSTKSAAVTAAAAVPPTKSPAMSGSGSGVSLVEIKDTGSTKGRGLFSSARGVLKPGTLVFRELGYCQVVVDKSLTKVCSACFKDVTDEVGEEEAASSGGQRQLVRCSGCHITCQVKDWKLHHQLECEGIRKSKTTPATAEVWTKRTIDTTRARVLCRMIRRRERAKASAAYKAANGKLDEAQKQVNDVYFAGLDEKEERWLDENGHIWIEQYLNSYGPEQSTTAATATSTENTLEESGQMTMTLALVMSCVTKKEDRHAFLRGVGDTESEDVASSGTGGFDLLRKLNFYGFAITNLQISTANGMALYVQCIPFMNHSCVPNCVYTFKGSRLECRVIRDIQPGEELTISYIDQIDTTKGRQKQLKAQYNFTCDCPLCKYYPSNPLVEPEEEPLKNVVSDSLSKPGLDPKQGFVCPNPECKSSGAIRPTLAVESQLEIYSKVELKCKECEQSVILTQELVQENEENAERLFTAFVREMNGGSVTSGASKANSRKLELAKAKAPSESINRNAVTGGMKSAQEPSAQALQYFRDAYRALTGVEPLLREKMTRSIGSGTIMAVERDSVRHSRLHHLVRRLEQTGFDEAVSHKNWIFALHRSIELEQILSNTYVGYHPLKAIQAYYTCKIANLLANLLLEESTIEIEDSDPEKNDEDDRLLDTDDENDLKALQDAMRKGGKGVGAASSTAGGGNMQDQLLRRKRKDEEISAEKKKRKALEKEGKKLVQEESSRELLKYLKSLLPKIENPKILQEFWVCWGKDGKLAIRYRYQIDSLKQALHYAELPFSKQAEQ